MYLITLNDNYSDAPVDPNDVPAIHTAIIAGLAAIGI
jgi:hypothetical protein